MQKLLSIICDNLLGFLFEIGLLDITKMYNLRKAFCSIGLRHKHAVTIFIYAHLFLPALFLLILFLISFFISLSQAYWSLIVIISTIICLLLPSLSIFIIRNRYKNLIKDTVTTFLELTCICSEFSSSMDASLKMMSDSMKVIKKNQVAYILDKLIIDLARMPSRKDAWSRFQKKMLTDDAAAIVKIIAQSDLYGMGLLAEQRQKLNNLRQIKADRIEAMANRVRSKVTIIATYTLLPLIMMFMFCFLFLDFKYSDAYNTFQNLGTDNFLER